MEERTFETVMKVMAEKIELLEWQLKKAEERNIELTNENKAIINKLEELYTRLEGDTTDVHKELF